jgi:hypothetical protein
MPLPSAMLKPTLAGEQILSFEGGNLLLNGMSWYSFGHPFHGSFHLASGRHPTSLQAPPDPPQADWMFGVWRKETFAFLLAPTPELPYTRAVWVLGFSPRREIARAPDGRYKYVLVLGRARRARTLTS